MIPQIDQTSPQDVELISYPSHTYRVGERKIEGFADGEAAMRQTIMHILFTERYTYEIYDDNYGTELEQYFGKPFEFIEAGIGQTITESLLQDDRILDVTINSITQTDKLDAIGINFTVITTLGTFVQEVTL